MSRYAGFGLILIAALVIIGCGKSKPEVPQPDASARPAEPPPAADAPQPAAAEQPSAETETAETKPTVLGAIGRAVAGAMGVSGEKSSKAPAYQPGK